MTSDLFAEIAIPVHDETRPIRRAVESVIAAEGFGALVIAHNLSVDLLDLPEHPRVRVIELHGHEGKPGACFDLGIAQAATPWVGIMGSDDWYETGALEAMRRRAHEDHADGVIAPQRQETHEYVGVRPLTLHTTNLKAARDRLFYRTAPLGIFKTEMMREPQYRFGSEFTNGSDMRVTAALWTSGRRFSYYWGDPAYVVGRGARTRVTFTPRPLSVTGAPYLPLFDEPAVQRFDKATKHAFAVKMARIHVLSAVVLRPTAADWTREDFEWLRDYVRALRRFDSRYDAALTRKEYLVTLAIEKGDLERTIKAAEFSRRGKLIDNLITRNPFNILLERDSPLRWVIEHKFRSWWFTRKAVRDSAAPAVDAAIPPASRAKEPS